MTHAVTSGTYDDNKTRTLVNNAIVVCYFQTYGFAASTLYLNNIPVAELTNNNGSYITSKQTIFASKNSVLKIRVWKDNNAGNGNSTINCNIYYI